MGSSFDRELKDKLKQHGCSFIRPAKGSHEMWYSPLANHNFAVPQDIRSRHTANGVLKQAGITDKF